MRSLAGKFSLRRKKDPRPSEGAPVICELAIPERVGQTDARSSNTHKHGAALEHQEQKSSGCSQSSPFVSQSFSHTQTVSSSRNAEKGCVEVTNVWKYKTAGPNRFDSIESPYGLANFSTFGPQWGTTASKGNEHTESLYKNAEIPLFGSQYGMTASKDVSYMETTYGKAEVPLYGPQYDIPTLSHEEDLYNDSDEEHSNSKSIKNLTMVQVVKVSTDVKAEDATRSPPPNDPIPQSWTWEYDAFNRKYDIVYKGSVEETKPTAIALATSSADSSLPSLGDMSKTAEKAEEPINPFADSAEVGSSWDIYGYSGDDMDVVFAPKTGPTSCVICTDDFSATLKAPGWITISCAHEPSVCCGCMARCIKSDLESKIWNQITCPECKTLLVYEDIQRLADRETFAKYEALSFRNAIGKDENFVWCQNCDFGQLHTGGHEQPIVRCMKCGFRSCFRHSVPWHDRLTCQEYDEMMNDPDGFKSAIERDDEAAALALKQQQEADERLARELEAQDRQAEEDRQRVAHEEELRIAREAQEAEAERKRLEKEEQERAKKREEIKLRKRQEELSLKTVKSTTKNCPGCQWPIEKNHGCSHMTCMSSAGIAWGITTDMARDATDKTLLVIHVSPHLGTTKGIKCRTEFCWGCLNDYNAIRKLGNSEHKPTCKFHSDNLPDLAQDEVDQDEDSD